jgi:4-hydroxybutyrate dehydrogenase
MALINYITTIQFGYGVLATLPSECARLGISRPLVVTDKGIRAAGLFDVLTKALEGLPVTVFDATPPNPNEAAVREGAKLFVAGRCDGVVAFGGGSSMDLSKGVALMATHPGNLRQYAAIEGGGPRITAAVAPVIAIPTTAGTGSEVGRGAVLILDDGRKVGILSPHLVPKAAICDPELTLGLPRTLTAATGMDAIAHCIETFLAPAFNPPADGIALDGLERAWAHLRTAVEHPGDRAARLNMMSASMQGALAFQKGLGCVHSLSHSLGGLNPGLHHGTLNAIFLPAVIEFNASAESVVAERRMERLARAMGLASTDHPARAIAEAIRTMNKDVGLPDGLGAVGVDSASHPAIVRGALADHCHKTNPRLASEEDYFELLRTSA